MRRYRSAVAIFACSIVAAAGAPDALACPICFGLIPETPLAERLGDSERALLAQPLTGQPGQFRIMSVIKGPGAEGDLISVPALAQKERPEAKADEAVLLVQEPEPYAWTMLGVIDVHEAPLLRGFAAMKHLEKLDAGEHLERLAYFARYLEDRRPMVAQAAYLELAPAPYAMLRSLRPVLDRERVRRWVGDKTLLGRQPLYLLLLGIAGDATDAKRIETRIDVAQRQHSSANLSAMLAADLELRGEPRVAFIERTYLLDRMRTTEEISAALLALSVHGNAPGVILRDRVVAAYRLLIRERNPLAGYVAPDLASWSDWGAVPDYLALLKSDVLDIPSRIAIVSYLRVSPNGEALTAR